MKTGLISFPFCTPIYLDRLGIERSFSVVAEELLTQCSSTLISLSTH